MMASWHIPPVVRRKSRQLQSNLMYMYTCVLVVAMVIDPFPLQCYGGKVCTKWMHVFMYFLHLVPTFSP